ncbi:hypothetical protein D5366_02795 [Neokomagataea tanensis]|uniref:YfhO family protein n=1 Tax=Neokomagataea tanensis TaxID=661191 RepID=A0A4Y6V4T8_9PROT|nr:MULTISPECIES: hypothetical protein [Neokomagataea]QDH24364.1 hypothetical protein D5366_02795 [Neokomagataea tanensis]
MVSSTVIVNSPGFTRGGFLPGNPGWIDGCAGVFVEALGRLVSRDWLHGIIPWWNPYSGVGMPLAGEYQPAAFFLPFVLYLALPNGLLLMKCTLQIIAGLATYSLLKKIKIDPRVALVGGLLYAFNGTYAWASDGPSEPLAFLPLALYGVECAREGRWGWLAVGLSYLMLAGFPETAYLLGLLVLSWAILRFFQVHEHKARYVKNIIVAGAVAGLIASPQLLSFATYLPYADIGSHAGLNDGALPPEAWSMLFFPYINGTFFYASQFDAWYSLGGFLGVILPFCALLSLGGRKDARLRWLLFGVAILFIGKQGNLAPFVWIVDHVPEAAHTVFYRLCEPVIEASLIFLTCFALDDIFNGYWKKNKYVLILLSIFTTLLGVIIYLDIPMIKNIYPNSYGPISSIQYSVGSIVLGLVSLSILSVLYLKKVSPKAIAFYIVFVSVVLFAFPLLSARVQRPLDTAFLQTLRDETKDFQRFATLGPVEPNYGAYFGIPSINFNAIPTPQNWIHRLRKDFGNGLDPVTFDGLFPQDSSGGPFLQHAALFRPQVFEAFAVSALVTQHDGLMVAPYVTEGRSGDGRALTPEKPSIVFDIRRWKRLSAQKIALQLGTYFHQSNGVLELSFCSAVACADGRLELKNANDNAFTTLNLDKPIPDQAERLSISLSGATQGVMLWGSAQKGEFWPSLKVEPVEAEKELVLVKRGEIGDIYRFRNPAPYFAVDPACNAQFKTRETLVVSCSKPAQLVRHELMMPGWSVTVNGRGQAIENYDGIFQKILLSEGRNAVTFHFEPPFAKFSFLLSFCGLVAVFLAFWRHNKPRKAGMDPL